MKKVNPAMLNFLDEKDDHFAGLRGTRDVVACKLCEDGIGASVKHAATISEDEETKLEYGCAFPSGTAIILLLIV